MRRLMTLSDVQSGVYAIGNSANGKFYVGCSRNMYKRATSHLKLLRSGKHYIERMQRDWNTHGEKSFRLFVVETCDEDKRHKRESHWIGRYKSFKEKHGYNSVIAAKIYPWEKWLGQYHLVVTKGVDYHCDNLSMAQQIRNAAREYGFSCRIKMRRNSIQATFRPKKHVGGQPSLLA